MKTFLSQRTSRALSVSTLFSILIFSFAPSVSWALSDALSGTGIPFTPDPTAAAQCSAWPYSSVHPCVSTSFFGLYTSAGICTGPGVCTATGITPLATITIGAIGGVVNGVVQLGMRALTGSGSTPTYNVPNYPNTSSYCPYGYTSSGGCAAYVPPRTSSTTNQNNSNALLNSLKPGNASNPLLVQPNNSNNPPYQSVGNWLLQQSNNLTTQNPSPSGPTQNTQNTISAPQSGAKGGIQLTSTSATIQAGVRDIGLNMETAGFFGTNAQAGTSPQDLITRMCLVRPWQSPLISAGIPPSLFDGFCSSKSLKVGVLPVTTPATSVKTTTPVENTTSTAKPAAQTSPSGPYVAPQVSIWASPASVPVGSRTSIFWAAKGVDACIETSPDGSFNGNSLYGSAATVPISAATVYTISCVAPDGSHVTDSVKVELAI